MNQKNTAGLCFLFLIMLPTLAHAFSSENVINIAKVYSNQYEEAVVVPKDVNPVIYKDISYWYAYFTPSDSNQKNLVMVIRQENEDGSLETGEDKLNVLLGIDYDLETLQIMKDQSISLDDLKNIMDQQKYALENVDTQILDNIKRQSEADFTKIDSAMLDATTSADDAISTIQEGIDYRDNFLQGSHGQEINIDDLNRVMDRQSESIDAVYKYIGNAVVYQKAIGTAQQEISDQSVVTELSKMGNLKVKDAVLLSYNSSFLAQKSKILTERKQRRASSINDTISSVFLRKAKVEATNAYSDAQKDGLIDSLLLAKNDQAFSECKLSNADLKKKWNEIKAIMDPTVPKNTEDYELLPLKISNARNVAENLNTRLSSCLSITATPVPKPQGTDFKGYLPPLMIGVVLILLIYYFGSAFKKKPEDDYTPQVDT